MNVLLNVYTFALWKKSAPFPSEGTVKCTHLTGRMPIKVNKNNAAAKVRSLVELGIYKVFKDI